MHKKPEILYTKSVAQSRIFHVQELHLRFENGEERLYERLRGGSKGSVMIVPMLDDDTVLLAREYGAGVEDYYLGLPKGIIEQDEDVLAAADREIQEEVGYGSRNLTLLKTLSASPGYMSRSMYLVLARDLYAQKIPGDEPEEIEVVPWKLSNLTALVEREDFHEARSIAALYMVKDLLNDKS